MNKQLAEEKKNIRLLISNEKDPIRAANLKNSFNQKSHEIRRRIKANNERKVIRIVEDIESANRINSSRKMYEAVKKLNRKSLPTNMFVYDKENKVVTDMQSVHAIVKDHFHSHFFKDNMQNITITGQVRLNNPIATEEVDMVISKMSNGKATGEDLVAVEHVKYAPALVRSEIANILNKHIEVVTLTLARIDRVIVETK